MGSWQVFKFTVQVRGKRSHVETQLPQVISMPWPHYSNAVKCCRKQTFPLSGDTRKLPSVGEGKDVSTAVNVGPPVNSPTGRTTPWTVEGQPKSLSMQGQTPFLVEHDKWQTTVPSHHCQHDASGCSSTFKPGHRQRRNATRGEV